MDYKTAYNFLIDQGMALETQKNTRCVFKSFETGPTSYSWSSHIYFIYH